MEIKTKKSSAEKIPKNKLFTSKIIINHDDTKIKLPSIIESENETVQSNDKYNKMLNVLFDKNKFKIRNEFDGKHSKVFLKEKIKYLQPMNLNDSLIDDIEYLNNISPKFTFGHL